MDNYFVAIGSEKNLKNLASKLKLCGLTEDTKWTAEKYNQNPTFLKVYGNGKFAYFRSLKGYHENRTANIDTPQEFNRCLEEMCKIVA